MATFNLTIELGNDAMQSPADIARALRRVAETWGMIEGAAAVGEEGEIRDLNGNTVGGWEVRDDG
jgi:hypothetical protein